MRAVTLLLALAITVPSAAVSQTILADVHIGRGPVQGRIVLGFPGYYYAPVVAHRYYEDCYRCRPVVVGHAPHGLAHGYYRVAPGHGAAIGRYHNSHHSAFHDLRGVSGWEREGQYRDDDD